MIVAITEWVKGIVFVVLFAAFLDLLLPNSSMQKFVRVIMGLFIMLAVLNPALNLLEENPEELPAVILNSADLPEATNISQNALQKREEITREYYVKDLAKQIRATVLSVAGVSDAKITVRLKENPDSPNTQTQLPQIARLEVLVTPQKENASLPAKSAPINITLSPTPKNSLSPETENKIKRAISELYQINAEIIEIGAL